MFIKVGRIYWTKPKPIPGQSSKVRPCIALAKYGAGKTIMIHLGSSNPKEPMSLAATKALHKDLDANSFRPRDLEETFVWIDPSKPEWNTSIIKPHIKIGGVYIDINPKTMKRIRQLYFKRQNELEEMRIRRAKGFVLLKQINKAKKQLQMLKDSNPIKHKNLDIDKFIKDNSLL